MGDGGSVLESVLGNHGNVVTMEAAKQKKTFEFKGKTFSRVACLSYSISESTIFIRVKGKGASQALKFFLINENKFVINKHTIKV